MKRDVHTAELNFRNAYGILSEDTDSATKQVDTVSTNHLNKNSIQKNSTHQESKDEAKQKNRRQ